MDKDAGREAFYGMPMSEWKARYQTEASDSQKAAFEVAFKENVTDKES
jgi:hypothetical protein